MIPARFVTLDALPLTPNGKVDRRALPEPPAAEQNRPLDRSPYRGRTHVCEPSGNRFSTPGPIGIDDNFFDLGGHSFLVTKLLRRIESEFGQRLSMAALFEAPTISRLAALLGDTTSIRRLPRTVNLQPAGAREPLFWIHRGSSVPASGNAPGHQPAILGHRFRARRRRDFEGFTFPGARGAPGAHIRAVQPHGPYYLGGWCIAGLLAYEAAAQLTEAGEAVKLVVVIDCATHSFSNDSKIHADRQQGSMPSEEDTAHRNRRGDRVRQAASEGIIHAGTGPPAGGSGPLENVLYKLRSLTIRSRSRRACWWCSRWITPRHWICAPVGRS